MKTHREKYLRQCDDKKLIEYIHTHSERGMDRLISALCNLQIVSYNPNPERVASARDYAIKTLEDASALHFALKELYLRYRKIKRSDKGKSDYIKMVLKHGVPEPDELLFGEFLDNVNEELGITEEVKQVDYYDSLNGSVKE